LLESIQIEDKAERQAVHGAIRYMLHIVDFLADAGLDYRGQSVKYMGWASLLVVKAAREGIPLVAFTTERDPPTCMWSFVERLRDGRVTWEKDKFA
jgi:hypothetical protein